jgi:hypothetical protein
MATPSPESESLPQPKRYKVSAKWLLGLTALTLLVPVLMVFVIFPWLSEQAFQSVAEIDTNEIDVLRVQLLNHPQGKDDVGPVEMNSADFAKLFAAIGELEKVKEIPAATWLGEYRVRFRDNRRGTIRFYWQKQNPSIPNSPAIIWMKIGSNYYRGGEVLTLFEMARECATRGKFQR